MNRQILCLEEINELKNDRVNLFQYFIRSYINQTYRKNVKFELKIDVN